MSYLPNNEQKMNEIIFANRNKEYGAYELRSNYGETVFKSLAIVMATFGTLAAIGFYATHRETIADLYTPPFTGEKVFVIPFKAPEDKVVEKKKTSSVTPPAANKENKSFTPIVVDSTETPVTNTFSATNASTLVTVPNETIPGIGGKGTETLVTEKSGGSITGIKGVKKGIEVDQLPEFEGGLTALNEFIRKNIRYPETAIEDNLGGKLYVKFIVDEYGYVNSAELENSIRADLNNEAMRVVRLIPKFKTPGMVDGEPVKTYYQIPINFRLR